MKYFYYSMNITCYFKKKENNIYENIIGGIGVHFIKIGQIRVEFIESPKLELDYTKRLLNCVIQELKCQKCP